MLRLSGRTFRLLPTTLPKEAGFSPEANKKCQLDSIEGTV